MPKSIISEGKTSTEAIEKGLNKLKLSKNQVEVKILEEKKKSFFNILAPHTVKVELTAKGENEQEKKDNEIYNIMDKVDINKAKENINSFLEEFLKEVSESISYKVETKDNTLKVMIKGGDSTRLIGYRGEALNALQTIISKIANKGQENIKVILDIGNYKDTRKKTLENLAKKLEKTVIKTQKCITLEPMTAYERKIIHSVLQTSEFVKTYSIGENENRRVVIAKK